MFYDLSIDPIDPFNTVGYFIFDEVTKDDEDDCDEGDKNDVDDGDEKKLFYKEIAPVHPSTAILL